jgi:TolB-like protein
MSGDPEQEYFSDGVTEDIITELSHFRSLLVTREIPLSVPRQRYRCAAG